MSCGVYPADRRREETRERRASVTRSPRAAATGVATLSGFTPNLLETRSKLLVSLKKLEFKY